MKHSRPYKAIMAELNAGYISESGVQRIRRALHKNERAGQGLSASSTSSGVTSEELNEIMNAVHKGQPRITDKQAAKGLAWLKNVYKSPTGKERKHNPFSAYETETLEDFDHFTLVDFQNVSRNYCAFYVPVYRVKASCGKYFDYYAQSWQSGSGGITVL